MAAVIGDNILQFRKKKGWSQEDLAEKMEVSRQTISKWESGRIVPGIERLKELAQVLDVRFYVLVEEPDNPQNNADAGIPSLRNEGDVPASKERADDKRKQKKIMIIALAIVALVAAGVFIIVSAMKPDYRRVDTLKEFIAEQVSSAVPYSTVELSALTPDTVRTQLDAKGIDVELADEVLQEAVDLYLLEYFGAYAEYGISYDGENHRLLFQDMEIGTFYDNNLNGTYQSVTWYGNGDVTVFIERDARGKLLDISVLDASGEYLAEYSE